MLILTITTVKVSWSSVAFTLYTVVDLFVAYALVADCVLSVQIWGQMPALSL